MYSVLKETLTALDYLLRLQKVQEIYTMPVPVLNNATIGQHIRHIIELYTCLLEGYNQQQINYDNRKRDLIIETIPSVALEKIQLIINHLEQPDKIIIVETSPGNSSLRIQSSYYRELLYNLEHCIHHQALIRAALISLEQEIVSENFGIAPSTIQYRKQCVQ